MQRKNEKERDTDDKTPTDSDAEKEEVYNSLYKQKKQKKKECIQKLKRCQRNRRESQPFKKPPKNGVETEKLCERIKYLDLYVKYKEEEKRNKKTMIYGTQWGVKRQIYPREFIEERIKKKEFERKYKNGNTILHICIIQGINDLAKKIIEEVQNTQQQNEEGLTPLHIACMQKNYEIFKYIIENKMQNLNIKDRRKRTCLHISSHLREYKFCKKLVKKRADVNIQSNKCYSPLVISMMNNDYKIVKMLVKNGALIEQQERINGQTPLMTMFMQKNEKGINYLIKKGATIQTYNENMESVINMALKFMCDINKNIELEEERKEYFKCLQMLLEQENKSRNYKECGACGGIWKKID